MQQLQTHGFFSSKKKQAFINGFLLFDEAPAVVRLRYDERQLDLRSDVRDATRR